MKLKLKEKCLSQEKINDQKKLFFEGKARQKLREHMKTTRQTELKGVFLRKTI